MEETSDTLKIDTSLIEWRNYGGDDHLKLIISMIEKELSEPYPILTYRYFVENWPELTFLAYYENECIGCIVNKLALK
jgi:peptide alpha-N-acetyltransferase